MTDEQIAALIARWREREHLAALHSVRNEYEAGQCRAYFTCAAELEALFVTGMPLREIVDQAFARANPPPPPEDTGGIVHLDVTAADLMYAIQLVADRVRHEGEDVKPLLLARVQRLLKLMMWLEANRATKV